MVKLHTHAKALALPGILFLALAMITGSLLALLPSAWGAIGDWVVIGIAVILAIVFCVVPFLRWLTTTYTITTRRIVTRTGIFNRVGHDLPLRRINDVRLEKGLIDRMFGCGTLVLTTASETPLTLPDMPEVEQVHELINDLLFGEHDTDDELTADVDRDE